MKSIILSLSMATIILMPGLASAYAQVSPQQAAQLLQGFYISGSTAKRLAVESLQRGVQRGFVAELDLD